VTITQRLALPPLTLGSRNYGNNPALSRIEPIAGPNNPSLSNSIPMPMPRENILADAYMMPRASSTQWLQRHIFCKSLKKWCTVKDVTDNTYVIDIAI